MSQAIQVPPPSKIHEPWIFRAACHLKEPNADKGNLTFGLILDLGFGIYRQIDAVLEGAIVPAEHKALAVEFATNWAVNGRPNDLEVVTVGLDKFVPERWHVHVYRIELDTETLAPLGRVGLDDALKEQGLVVCLKDASGNA